MCAFVVLGFVFSIQAKRLFWGTSPKWPILCRLGRKTLTSNYVECLCSVFGTVSLQTISTVLVIIILVIIVIISVVIISCIDVMRLHVCSGLPSKSPDDIIRHQLMYDQMVEEARKKGWYSSHPPSAFTYTCTFLCSFVNCCIDSC